MRIHQVKIKNFRLLRDVELILEDQTTLIVGRNNSGKTSLSEVMRRFLSEGTATFQLEDFSSACYDGFCDALNAHQNGSEEAAVRSLLPAIELQLLFNYDSEQNDLGPLARFIVDLDPTCTNALAIIRYELKDGRIANLFEGVPNEPLDEKTRLEFFRSLRERIPSEYGVRIRAEDPNDNENHRELLPSDLRKLIKTGFINAQRGLDDITSRESDVLAKVLESIFTTASSPTADDGDQKIAKALSTAVQDIQTQIDESFAGQLTSLLPTLQSFGYPGLGGQELHTETILDIQKLLSNFTKVRYAGYSGIALPESYNGLGVRNLIFILFQLVGFYKAFQAETMAPGVHVVFIEEPEAHLHPQMQEVFIRQLAKIARQLAAGGDEKSVWPVQFVVSTHSSHIANEAGFESIRYFLGSSNPSPASNVRQTKIKDLREGLRDTPEGTKKFLHQYLTLTRCDLFFADKAVLVEGLSERLLLPIIIGKLEEADSAVPKLSTQYLTVMEVGGAYAHLFFNLLKFLELRTLIITDLDSVSKPGGTACAVHQGKASSNACLKEWFSDDESPTLEIITSKDDKAKVKDRIRIAFQRPEENGGPCGRTFEDAFILANSQMFKLLGNNSKDLELEVREKSDGLKKSEFALKYAIAETNWTPPNYILEGIRWLALDEIVRTDSPLNSPVQIAETALGGAGV